MYFNENSKNMSNTKLYTICTALLLLLYFVSVFLLIPAAAENKIVNLSGNIEQHLKRDTKRK